MALAVPDVRDALTRALFIRGFAAMLDAAAPRLVLVYGRLPPECRGLALVREFPPDWTRLRQLGPRQGVAAAAVGYADPA